MKRVRMLLRVSSDQQLEADGDLSIQRQIVKEYIAQYDDWCLDKKEYFEGSNSGYKNSVADRNILQEALEDAKNREEATQASFCVPHGSLGGVCSIGTSGMDGS